MNARNARLVRVLLTVLVATYVALFLLSVTGVLRWGS
jgi:hypothetical protein